MDEQSAIDKILEVENLTDELDDDQANTLINWATKHVPALIANLQDEPAGDKVNDLMAVMRKVNALSTLRKSRTPDQLQGELQQYMALVQKVFGAAPVGNAAERTLAPLAQDLPKTPDDQFVQSMLDLADSVHSAHPAPDTKTNPPAAPASEDEESPTLSI